ncbi:hypothetical protein JOM56_013996 [Amanita muscaria]
MSLQCARRERTSPLHLTTIWYQTDLLLGITLPQLGLMPVIPTLNSGLPGLRLVAYVNYRFSYHTIIALLFVPRFLLFVFTFERHRCPSVFDSSDRRTGTSYDCLSALMPHARIQS